MNTQQVKPMSQPSLARKQPLLDMRQAKIVKNITVTVAAWLVALTIFFPIFWMVLTSLKTELNAFSTPPALIFKPTLENYVAVFERSDYLKYAWNSVVVSFGASIIGMVIAIPAAYSMAFYPTKRTQGVLLWMLSTKMLPPVGVLVPLYLLARDTSLLDTKTGLTIIYTLINLPIVIWMIYTYFREVPKDILEAVRMDGANLWQEIRHVLIPITLGGLSSTFLLSLILSWNEAFWSLNLTASKAAPLTALIASYSSPEGLFWAKLSAASTLAVAPILVFGWISQKQLVRGLTFGAVK
ncbi:mannitol ABC transporter permease [Saccharospirillum salsuginis]|uniref:Mannitol ABC transporter permease n=2 Tax=Saccharospirillum salsuginis TaxID=418750 RepID=A0A918NH85_9GAMM|nr:mannitol ABC transporter permease [Saccharospirillum salsuginis]